MAMNAMRVPASLNLWGNQESSEIKCYLDRVFEPMIKKWYWIVRWFLDRNNKLPEKSRDFNVLLKKEVNNRRCQEIFTTLPLIVVDPSNVLPDKFKDLR